MIGDTYGQSVPDAVIREALAANRAFDLMHAADEGLKHVASQDGALGFGGNYMGAWTDFYAKKARFEFRDSVVGSILDHLGLSPSDPTQQEEGAA